MENIGLLSIIVPVYKAGKYLEPLIKSIQNQCYKNFELILVDDGSPDNSGAICDYYSQEDSRISVIHKTNGGQSSARNAGLDSCKGEFIAFADHDDIVHPQMYQDMINAMIQYGADVCAGNFLNVNESDMQSLILNEYNSSFSVINKKELLDDYFKPTWRIPIWNKVYRGSLVKNLRFGDYHLGEDNYFSYEVIKNCTKYLFTDSVYYFQRMHGMNYEYTAVEYMSDLLLAKEKILNDIKVTFPESYKICQRYYIYECIRIYNYYSKDIRFRNKQYQAIELLIKNSQPVLCCSIPTAHKMKIVYYSLLKKDRLPVELVF